MRVIVVEDEQVMADAADLVRVRHVLRQLVNVKGY